MLTLSFSGKKISTDKPAFVMGILNVTPDSFYEKSRGTFDKAMNLIEEGADIIDIGGESTRPGFKPVSADEEIRRIIPIIKEIRKKSDVLISVDTTKSEVMKVAYEYGANIVNDISSFNADINMASFAAKNNLSVILTHNFSYYDSKRSLSCDILKEVSDYLFKQIDFGIEKGIKRENFIIDCGIGFGKTFEENCTLIASANKLCNGEFPVLMALSRKRCISEMINNGVLKDDVEERLFGTISANLLAVINGAKIIRVHDVKAAVDSLIVAKNVMKNL